MSFELSEPTKILLENVCPGLDLDDANDLQQALAVLAELAEFESPPPTIDQFLDDPQYLGHIGPTVYPFWRQKLRELFPSPYWSKYNEVAITGSTGGGKTTFCLIAILYELCVFLHRKNPHLHYGFTEGEPISIGLCNATLTLSQDVQLQKFFNMFNNSPFFKAQQQKHLQESGKPLDKGKLALNMPHEIDLLAGSVAQHLIGRAILAAMMSELNAQKREGGNQAVNTYVELKNRLFTRFGNRGGNLRPPGKLYLDSSKKEAQGVLEQYIEALKKSTTTLIIEAAFWEFTAGSGKDNYCGEKFKVFRGTPTEDPRVLKDDDEDDQAVPESLIVEVPIELKEFFDVDPINALRDLGGVSTWSTGNFIQSIAAINDALVLPQVVKKPIVKLDLFNKEDVLMKYVYMDHESLTKDVPYYVHFDLSKNRDRTGMAFTRISGTVEKPRLDRTEGLVKLLQEYEFKTDLAICLAAKPNQEIPIYKLEDFLYDFQAAGYQIAAVSMDSAFSADILQRLKAAGILAEKISVDKPRAAYDTFRMVLLEHRWKGPHHDPHCDKKDPCSVGHILWKELKELIDEGDMINHPEETAINKAEHVRPSKDLADAVCGSVYNCILKNPGVKLMSAMENLVQTMEQAGQPKDEKQAMEQHMFGIASQFKNGKFLW